MLLTATERLTMNTRPKNPANARNLNFCGIGSSGSGKTRFWLTPQLLQAHSSYVVVDPKGGVLGQVGSFLQKRGYKIKVFNSIDFSKSMHYNPLAYIKTEADILKFVNALISNTKGEGKEGDPFWTKAETLLYQAKREMENYERRKVYHRAYYSLDAYSWLENYALEHSRSPEDILLEREEMTTRLHLIAALPVALAHATPTQARRVHAYYIAGIKQPEISRREGVHSSKVSVSIRRGLRNMRRCYDDLFQTE